MNPPVGTQMDGPAGTAVTPPAGTPAEASAPAPADVPRADALGLRGCTHCGLVFALTGAERAAQRAGGDVVVRCPRCAAPSRRRIPHSLQATWAWLLTAVLAYVPANVYPVFSTTSFGAEEGHTIIGGVVELYEGGSWDLALVVFVASVVVPVLKMAALAILCVVAQRRAPTRASPRRQQNRARMYRGVEAIGHWSMLDIFVVALLVALVQFDQVMTVRPQVGAVAFGIVVVATMLSSHAYDPRLMWDRIARARRRSRRGR